ncbi:MAG: hypothetical protein R3F59_36330 [Myxococcota bacterium]
MTLGLDWDGYVAWLVAREGSLAAVADRLAAARGHVEDVGTVERALRRLRARDHAPGGKWGDRAVRLFGLPGDVDDRLRWMGTYHARFTDLPLPVCADLVRLWDRPPTSEARTARAWLDLAHASLDIRAGRPDDARARLQRSPAPDRADAAVERALTLAFTASRVDPDDADTWLQRAGARLPEVADPAERACLHARWIDQRAWALNHADPPDWAGAEALYREIPDDPALPPLRPRAPPQRAGLRARRLGRRGRGPGRSLPASARPATAATCGCAPCRSGCTRASPTTPPPACAPARSPSASRTSCCSPAPAAARDSTNHPWTWVTSQQASPNAPPRSRVRLRRTPVGQAFGWMS